jgi:hypothetical protein
MSQISASAARKSANKIHGHLMINMGKRTLTLIGTHTNHLTLAVTLNDGGVHDHTIIHHLPHLILRAVNQTIAN